MNCKDFDRHFADYVDGNLPDKIKDALDRHIETCSECKGSLDLYNGIGDVPRIPVPPCPPDLVSRAVDRFEQEEQARQNGFWQRMITAFHRPVVYAPVALAALLVVGILLQQGPISPVDHSTHGGSHLMGVDDRLSVAVMMVDPASRDKVTLEMASKAAGMLECSQFRTIKAYAVDPKAYRALTTIYRRLKNSSQVGVQQIAAADQEKFWPASRPDAVVVVYLGGKHDTSARIAAVNTTGLAKLFPRSVTLSGHNAGCPWARDIGAWLKSGGIKH